MIGIQPLVIDFETDGVNPLEDHAVTVTIMRMGFSAQIQQQASWLLDFGGEIPAGATAVHGITTEHMRRHGQKNLGSVISTLLDIIELECVHKGATLVAYKAAFDLTLLETERRRYCPERAPLDYSVINVFDPLVAWKQAVKKRRGKRTLVEAAKAYGIPVDETRAHDAAYDCYLAGSVAVALLERTAWMGRMSGRRRHEEQVKWAAEQAKSLQDWFTSQGKNEIVDPRWPTLHNVDSNANQLTTV